MHHSSICIAVSTIKKKTLNFVRQTKNWLNVNSSKHVGCLVVPLSNRPTGIIGCVELILVHMFQSLWYNYKLKTIVN